MIKIATNFINIAMLKTAQQIHLELLQKTQEAADDLIDNKIANKITQISKISQQNNSETVANNHDKEVPKERYVYPEERQEVIDELGLKYYKNGISKNLKALKNPQKMIQTQLQIRTIPKKIRNNRNT